MKDQREYDRLLREKRKARVSYSRKKIVSFLDECDSLPSCEGGCPYIERCLSLEANDEVFCELTDVEADVTPSLGFSERRELGEGTIYDAPKWTFYAHEWGK
jgi:hypothetical protein